MAGGAQGSPSLTQMAGAGLSGYGLSNSIGAGNGVGIAGNAANLANNLGVPSSVTQPVQFGAQAANLGLDVASGNYLGAISSLLGLGGGSGLIPSSISQPAGLALSALTGNPIGMGIGAYNVGKGMVNMFQGLNYNGSWTPSQAQQAQIGQSNQTSEDQIASGASDAMGTDATNIVNGLQAIPDVTASLAQAPHLLSTPSSSGGTFTPTQLAQIGQNQTQNFDQSNIGFFNTGSYAGSPTNVMNQGEAETPVATMTPQAAMQAVYQQAMQSAQGNPQAMAQLQSLLG